MSLRKKYAKILSGILNVGGHPRGGLSGHRLNEKRFGRRQSGSRLGELAEQLGWGCPGLAQLEQLAQLVTDRRD